jgi:ABC-2 type transport system ATP-binding protein
VFLDEPTNGLDPMARRALREDIVALASEHGATVFVTTHDIDDADRMCDLVGVMLAGTLIATGSPSELRARAGSGAVRLRGTGFGGAVDLALRALPGVAAAAAVEGGVDVTLSTPGAPAAPLVAAAVAAGAGVEGVARADASLEDAFVGLVRSGAPGGEAA